MASHSSYSSSMYERVLRIDEFKGVDQSFGVYNGDYGTSPDAVNFVSRYGRLYTTQGNTQYGDQLPSEQSSLSPVDGRIFQAFFRDANGDDFSYLIYADRKRLHYAGLDAEDWNVMNAGFSTNDWSAVNYRDEDNDWFIITNGTDGMYYWDGINQQHFVRINATQGVDEHGDPVPIYFDKLVLLNERLWGGVSHDHPDRIYWSNTFDPEDWDFNFIDSDNLGGGFVDVATFDGTKIRAIISAFDDVLIFKDKSMHRLSGTYPGEFALTQVYGSEGTLAPRTVVYNGKRLYFLSCDGLCMYDGTSVITMADSGDRRLKDIWSRINPSTISQACAVMKDTIIYLSVPLDGSTYNTHVIEYDTATGIYSIVALAGVDDWLLLREGQKETLLYIDRDKVYKYGSGYTFNGDPINAYWISPEITCGSLASKKSTGRIYLSVDASSLSLSRNPSIKITMSTDGKTRSKVIPLKTGINRLRKRVKIRGRTFRFMLENQNGDPMSINGGIEIRTEEDFD